MPRSATVEAVAVLLDLDGVLVESAAAIRRSWQWWAGQLDVGWERLAPWIPGRAAVDTIAAVRPDLDRPALELEAGRVNERQLTDLDDVHAVTGMPAVVAALRGRPWAVVTAGPRRLARARLAAAGYPQPPELVAVEDTGRGKPHPDPYLCAATRLGVEQRHCLVVEDAPSGIESARAAAMPVVALATTAEPERLTAADHVVADGTALHAVAAPGGPVTVRLNPLLPR